MRHLISTLLVLAFTTLPIVAKPTPPPGVVKQEHQIKEITLDSSESATELRNSKITPCSESTTYSDWEYIGMASWSESLWRLFSNLGIADENHFRVEKRTSIENPSQVQVKLVGVFSGSDFIIDTNTETYECSASRQASNIEASKITSNAELTCCDVGIRKRSTYGNLVSNISLAGGQIYFNMVLYHLKTSENFYVLDNCSATLDYAPEFSYKINGRHLYGKDESVATFSITSTGAAKRFKYICLDYNTTATAPTAFTEYADQIKTATDSISIPLKTGCWRLHVFPFDADGNWLGIEHNDYYIWGGQEYTFHSNADEAQEWIDFGQVKVNEGVISDHGLPLPKDAPNSFYCRVLTPKNNPGKIMRLVNPYGPTSPIGSCLLENNYTNDIIWGYNLPNEDFYIDINIENPDRIYTYNRPIGLEYKYNFETNMPYGDEWTPMGTSIYPAHSQILYGLDHDRITYGYKRWNRLFVSKYLTFNIELSSEMTLSNNIVGDNNTVELKVNDNVQSVKYSFLGSKYDSGVDIADKIAANDSTITIYTANYTGNSYSKSKDGSRIIKINIPDKIKADARLIAVPYNSQETPTGTYLDEIIRIWHNIGTATISGDLCDFYELKQTVDVEQRGSSKIFRLAKPSKYEDSSEYLYINATDPENVNISSDGNTTDFLTYVNFDGYAHRTQINTTQNYIANGILGDMEYLTPYLSEQTVTFPVSSIISIITYNNYDIGAYYIDESFITLPNWDSTSTIETITPSTDNTPDAPVEYFNLQGLKITNPGPGIYIRRQGSKTDKIFIR